MESPKWEANIRLADDEISDRNAKVYYGKIWSLFWHVVR